MHVTPEHVAKLAAMSKLQLTKEEQSAFPQQLEEILTYVDMLSEVDTTNVPPTSQVTGLMHTTYPDVPSTDPFAPTIAADVLKQTQQPVEMKQIKVPNVLTHD